MGPLLLSLLLGAAVVHVAAPRPGRPSATVASVVASSYAVDFRLELAGGLGTLRTLTGPGLAVGVEGGLPAQPLGPLRVRIAIPSCARLPRALESGAARSTARLLDVSGRDRAARTVTLRVSARAAPQLYAAIRALAGRVCPAGSYRLPG